MYNNLTIIEINYKIYKEYDDYSKESREVESDIHLEEYFIKYKEL